MTRFHAENFDRSREKLAGFDIGITTYRLGDVFVCRIDNVSPGAMIAREKGHDLEVVRARAVDVAKARLEKTRRFGT